MFKTVSTAVLLAVTLAGCGTFPGRPLIDEAAFQNDRRQSAGNAALARSLREAKPLVNLSAGEP